MMKLYNKWYINRLPSGAATYGRMRRVCFFNIYDYVGAMTPDQYDDCVLAAFEKIRSIDATPTISIMFD